MMMGGDGFEGRYRMSYKADPKAMFRTFLRMNAKSDGLIANVIENLEPFWKIGTVESYPWTPAQVIAKERVAEAARHLSYREVTGVEIIPIGKLALFGGSLLQENFQERLVAEVDRGSVCYTVEELLAIDFAAKNFEWRFMESIRNRFLDGLWTPFEAALQNGTEKVNRAHGVKLGWKALQMMAYYYVCSGILADKFARVTMARYEATLRLVGKGVILWGEERGATGVWFALAG